MTIKKGLLLLAVFIPHFLAAQLKEGKDNIMKLCGCYDVTFEYKETFRTDSNYQFHKDKVANALELIMPIEESDNKVVLQHMLIVNENYIIKHWREDWSYEKSDLLSYQGDNVWTKVDNNQSDAKSKWTQTVWQVDDMPRYQGYSSWITNNGKTYWENTADAPLPRREYTTRSDYNVMRRNNRIIIQENGWLHEQDNEKILRKNGKDSLLVREKGYNTYVKVDASKCAKAKKSWEENQEFWSVVKTQWNKYINEKEVLKVKEKVDDEPLFKHFYVLESEWKDNKWNKKQLAKKVTEVMDKFIM